MQIHLFRSLHQDVVEGMQEINQIRIIDICILM